MLQGEAVRLSSERDVALTKLKETEETVFILQQTVEVCIAKYTMLMTFTSHTYIRN